MMVAQDLIGEGGGIVVANPVPEDKAWNKADHDRVLATAFAAAEKAGVRGKEVTPFLLQFIVQESKGKSLEVNLDLARNNVAVAAEIALAYSQLGED
jgi:pseudouridine-5'-phosphate glycosidase